MPLYVFACPSCSASQEELQKYSDPAPTCVKCDAPMARQVARTSFELKGWCWKSDGYTARHQYPTVPKHLRG